ncbi:MAG: tetratricopeptide repeat protein [Flavobacteriales bacterium]|nr:tetratricopeptide repeat protein [Flavobacteriales bacterium]
MIISDKNANTLFEQGEFEKAAHVFNTLSADNPDNTFFSYMLGVCYYEIGEIDKALVNLDKSLIGIGSFGNSSPTEAFYYYAMALQKNKQFSLSTDNLHEYQWFIQKDLKLKTSQIRSVFGEVTEENEAQLDAMLIEDQQIVHLNEVLVKIEVEVEKNEKLVGSQTVETDK